MRTIPRDFFNQANLLENLGRLYIALEDIGKEDILFDDAPDGDSFIMRVDEYNNTQAVGDIFLKKGDENLEIFRYVNSRERYSIYVTDPETEEDIEIFNEKGSLSEDFLELFDISQKKELSLKNIILSSEDPATINKQIGEAVTMMDNENGAIIGTGDYVSILSRASESAWNMDVYQREDVSMSIEDVLRGKEEGMRVGIDDLVGLLIDGEHSVVDGGSCDSESPEDAIGMAIGMLPDRTPDQVRAAETSQKKEVSEDLLKAFDLISQEESSHSEAPTQTQDHTSLSL